MGLDPSRAWHYKVRVWIGEGAAISSAARDLPLGYASGLGEPRQREVRSDWAPDSSKCSAAPPHVTSERRGDEVLDRIQP